MNTFLVFAAILATVFARPDGLLHGNDGHVSVTQSTLGTYKYTVHLKDSIKTEERLADGTVIGEYTVPDANGVPLTFRYTSGRDGFKILEGAVPVAPVSKTLVPAPVEDTPEVKAAREEFLALHRAAAARTVL